jgi:uncharacterized membrane protein YdbT with pleckstrin-like domain
MAAIAISVIAFLLALVGVLVGSVMQRMLPESQLTSGSKEVIKLSIGVVATLAALVLGFCWSQAPKALMMRARPRQGTFMKNAGKAR